MRQDRAAATKPETPDLGAACWARPPPGAKPFQVSLPGRRWSHA